MGGQEAGVLEQLERSLVQQQRVLQSLQSSLQQQLQLLQQLKKEGPTCSSAATLGQDTNPAQSGRHLTRQPEEELIGVKGTHLPPQDVGVVLREPTQARTVASVQGNWGSYFNTLSAVQVDGEVTAMSMLFAAQTTTGTPCRARPLAVASRVLPHLKA